MNEEGHRSRNFIAGLLQRSSMNTIWRYFVFLCNTRRLGIFSGGTPRYQNDYFFGGCRCRAVLELNCAISECIEIAEIPIGPWLVGSLEDGKG